MSHAPSAQHPKMILFQILNHYGQALGPRNETILSYPKGVQTIHTYQ